MKFSHEEKDKVLMTFDIDIKEDKIVIQYIYDYDLENTRTNVKRIIEKIKEEFNKTIEFSYSHFIRESIFSTNYIVSTNDLEDAHERLSDILQSIGFNVSCFGDKHYMKYTHVL